MKNAAIKQSSKSRAPTVRERETRHPRRKVPLPDGRGSETMSQIPADVVAQLVNAVNTGQWLIAVFRVENEKLCLDRTAMNFPKSDLDLANRLFVDSTRELGIEN